MNTTVKRKKQGETFSSSRPARIDFQGWMDGWMDERSVAKQDSWEYSLEDTLQDQIQVVYYIVMATRVFRYFHSLLLC